MTERWQLIAGFMTPTWAIVLLAVCALAASAEALWALQRDALPLPARLAILALRLLAIAGLFAVAFELSLAIDHVREYGPRVVVLVDDSASMGIADRAAPRGPATAAHARALRFELSTGGSVWLRRPSEGGGFTLSVEAADGEVRDDGGCVGAHATPPCEGLGCLLDQHADAIN